MGDAGVPFYVSIVGLDAGAGFFDVAPERDDAGTVWMSYSAVTNDLQYPSLRRVETHLARSDDNNGAHVGRARGDQPGS